MIMYNIMYIPVINMMIRYLDSAKPVQYKNTNTSLHEYRSLIKSEFAAVCLCRTHWQLNRIVNEMNSKFCVCNIDTN